MSESQTEQEQRIWDVLFFQRLNASKAGDSPDAAAEFATKAIELRRKALNPDETPAKEAKS